MSSEFKTKNVYNQDVVAVSYELIWLFMSSTIKDPQLACISYRDMKNKFAIIVDDNQTKNICSLVFKEKVKNIEINGSTFTLEDVTVASITKLKKQLTDRAIDLLG